MNGIFSALLGVFNADGDINEDGVRALVRHNIDKCGIDGLYVNGSTGETFLMTMEMRKKVLRTVADEAKGQVSLIAHVGGICLDDVTSFPRKRPIWDTTLFPPLRPSITNSPRMSCGCITPISPRRAPCR